MPILNRNLFNNDLFWISAVFFTLVVLVLIVALLLKFLPNFKKTNNLIFQSGLPILISAAFLYVVFLGYHRFPSSNSIFAKLTSGEVIVGIAIASPSLYMWYKNNQKKDIDKAFDSLNKEYIEWISSINGDNNLANVNYAKLRVLLDKEKAYYKISKNRESFKPIDWHILFLSIQDKIREYYSSNSNELSNDYFSSWREINSLIIKEKKDELNKEDIKKLSEVYAIDFQTNEDFLQEFTHTIYFRGCSFKYTKLKDFSDSRNKPMTVEWAVLDEKDSADIIGERYFYPDEFTEELIEEKGPELSSNNLIQYNGEKAKIFENRDLSDRGAINHYILGNQAYNIVVSSETSNLKKSLYNKLTSVLKENGQNIDDGTYSLSKSKNFIPNMKESDSDEWVWHSWNVLNKEKADDEKIKYFIFAINVEGEKYSCIILKREKLQELIQYKTLSKDNRYFFYFAEMKS